MAFLEERRMVLQYKGCTSEEEPLPGGGPAGTKLGLFLFQVLINKAGYKPNELCVNVAEEMNKPKRLQIKKTQEKYVDDMTQCVAVNLKKVAVLNPNPTCDLPRQYHERTGHVLPAEHNYIQQKVNKLKQYAKDKKMVINESKTKIIVFNEARSVDILPKVKLSEENMIEVVDDMKLLGVMIRSDLKWHDNTEHIIRKSFQRMWILRNLKRYGAEENLLLEAYTQQIRSITEMACPVWNGALTQQEERALERIQRTALAVIRGDKHTTYREALEYFEIDT